MLDLGGHSYWLHALIENTRFSIRAGVLFPTSRILFLTSRNSSWEPGSRTGACARSMASASVGWYRVQGGVAGPHARSSSAAGRRVWRFRHACRLRMRYLILSQRAWRNRHTLAFVRVDVALLRVTTCEVVLSRRVWRFRTTCTDRACGVWPHATRVRNLRINLLILRLIHFKDLAGVASHTQLFG